MLDFTLGDDFDDALEHAFFSVVDGFDGVRTDGEFIRRGEADAGVSVVDGEDGVIVHRVAYFPELSRKRR